jgi:hypothetical protein
MRSRSLVSRGRNSALRPSVKVTELVAATPARYPRGPWDTVPAVIKEASWRGWVNPEDARSRPERSPL